MKNLGFSDARHLVTRTGLGSEWGTILRYQKLSRQQALDHLFKNKDFKLPPPNKMSAWPRMLGLKKNMRSRKMVNRIGRVEGKGIQNWWVKHLLATRSPFLERMTLFWHNHFPSSISKTNMASMLYQQNLLLRKHALGNFKDMLFAIAKDPAMLLYLDGYISTKDEPNENFARELLELFTLGIGHYSENDMREAARAFTGWGIDDRSGRFVNRPNEHDNGTKTFLGKRGNFRGEDIINILLRHPRTAETIAEKMWHEFISISRPDRRITRQWASRFRNSNYDIPTLLKAVLNSDVFWARHHRGALIKSPVELTIGTLRTLPYSIQSHRNNLSHNLSIMGQELFNHPSVKGWTGGKDWISSQSLLRRNSILNGLARGNLNEHRNRGGITQKLPNIKPLEMQQWLLPIKPLKPMPEKPGNQRLVRALVLDPAYQVT